MITPDARALTRTDNEKNPLGGKYTRTNSTMAANGAGPIKNLAETTCLSVGQANKTTKPNLRTLKPTNR